jgi:predicted lipoprotein with Yx(FWY)xxD motif
MDRNITALAVLAAAGLAGTGAVHVLDGVIPPAAAQEADRAEQAERELERAEERAEDRFEAEIARAAGPESGAQVTQIRLERSEHGRYLADQDGRALYLLESETGGESNCYDRCAEQWPPAIVRQGETPETRGRQIDEDLLGTTSRRDGSMQITYGDYPLYYYYLDQSRGEVTGHDVHDEWGGWYLVSADGEPLDDDEDE